MDPIKFTTTRSEVPRLIWKCHGRVTYLKLAVEMPINVYGRVAGLSVI
ncbi:MAG: hypothetical protein OXC80_09555 [Gammaproteobacteria bacterium]|nr:hypothetical protein [Gammaproteobacteria bacterium]